MRSRCDHASLDPVLRARFFRLLAEETDDLDRPLDVSLTGQTHRLVRPALLDPPQEPRGQPPRPQEIRGEAQAAEREFLVRRGRREILPAGHRNDRAGRALAFAAANVPELGVGVERGVPEPVSLPDVDLLAVDHAADLP